MGSNQNLPPFLSWIFILGIGVSACSPSNPEQSYFNNPEFTGGTQASSGRPFTQTTDGSDGALNAAKSLIGQSHRQPLKDLRIEVSANFKELSFFSSDFKKPLVLTGELPSPQNSQSQWTSPSEDTSLILTCLPKAPCPSTLLGHLKTSTSEAAFILRSNVSYARFLFLSKNERYQIEKRWASTFPAVASFLSYFQESRPVQALSYEIVNGRSKAQLVLNWPNDERLCLAIDITATDTDPAPLPKVEITCAPNFPPDFKIDLVGNTQKGKIALGFQFREPWAFILYVDLNGEVISNEHRKGMIDSSIIAAATKSLLPQESLIINRIFPMKKMSPRALDLVRQLYRDAPQPQDNLISPEQKYGIEIVQKWVRAWQGEAVVPKSCWRKNLPQLNLKGSLNKFVKKAPKYYQTIQKLFEKYDLPSYLMFITLIESPRFYNNPPQIEISSKGAVGPWQIMEPLAKEYGLLTFPLIDGQVDPRDERQDFQKSSQTALAYLDKLLDYLGNSDYKLALASFNQGPTKIFGNLQNLVNPKKYEHFYHRKYNKRRDIELQHNYQERLDQIYQNLNDFKFTENKGQGKWWDVAKALDEKIPNYWFLHEFHMMSCETRDYVPKIISAIFAAATAGPSLSPR